MNWFEFYANMRHAMMVELCAPYVTAQWPGMWAGQINSLRGL